MKRQTDFITNRNFCEDYFSAARYEGIKFVRNPFKTGLAYLFDSACANCLYISKKSFRVPMENIKSKIKYCNLP